MGKRKNIVDNFNRNMHVYLLFNDAVDKEHKRMGLSRDHRETLIDDANGKRRVKYTSMVQSMEEMEEGDIVIWEGPLKNLPELCESMRLVAKIEKLVAEMEPPIRYRASCRGMRDHVENPISEDFSMRRNVPKGDNSTDPKTKPDFKPKP